VDLYVTQGLNSVRSFNEFAEQLKKMFQPPDIRHNAEKRLLTLKQGKETVEDFMTQLKQLVIKAEYNIAHHSRLLINIMRNGIHNEVVEMVERSQPHLLNNPSFSAWESTLVQASAILQDIANQKRGTVQSTYQHPFHPLPHLPHLPPSTQTNLECLEDKVSLWTSIRLVPKESASSEVNRGHAKSTSNPINAKPAQWYLGV